jgi:hypothetical protein
MKFRIHLPNFGAFGDARVLANLAEDINQPAALRLRACGTAVNIG